MIQCIDCILCTKTPDGQILSFQCDPFKTIVEPECLSKWQIMKTSQMVAAYQATLNYYHKLAPMQEKMFRVMERELDDISEADQWKVDENEEYDPEKDKDQGDDWEKR